MEEQPLPPRLIRYLPHMVVVTTLVAVCPMLLAWWLSSDRVVSLVLSMVAATAWSLAAAQIGGRYWRARPDGGDVLFGDLMIWGWLRRLRSERRIRSALTLLEGIEGTVSAQQREQALVELAVALEVGDPYTSGHSRRVARHAARLAQSLGLAQREVAKIRTAAVLHDVGKIRTPKSILHKAGRLTDGEYAVIKLHPVDGAEMVASLGDPELAAIIRHHHERLDGAGYPDGLTGDAIPLGARIIAVADTFDAITSVRSYRQARSHRKALTILEAEAGSQLDSDAVKAFQRYYLGSRPLAVWVPFGSIAQRLTSLLGGGVSAGATSVGRVALAAGVTSATAAAAVSLPAAPGRTTPHHLDPAGPAEVAAVRAPEVAAVRAPAAPATAPTPSPGHSRSATATHRGRTSIQAKTGTGHHAHTASGPKPIHRTGPAVRPPVYVSNPRPVVHPTIPMVTPPGGGATPGPAGGGSTTPPGGPVGTSTGGGTPAGGKPKKGSGGSGNPGKGHGKGGGSGKSAGSGSGTSTPTAGGSTPLTAGSGRSAGGPGRSAGGPGKSSGSSGKGH